MKNIKTYIPALLTAVALCLGFTSCQDDIDAPKPDAPVAKLQPNMTIAQLKEMFWDDATNYIDTIGIENGVADDKEYIIRGRVISSDEQGNIFKSLVIQDETAALALSINSYNLYLQYRRGQEVVLNVKGMFIGKYNGLQQLGFPEWYANGNAWEATFMSPEFFQQHVELNGNPEPQKIDTLVVNSFSELSTNPEGLRKWQSQIVRFNNVSFQNAGTAQFVAEYHSSGENQNIVDADGTTLPVRTSGYATFWNKRLPKGNGDVVGILSYYGTTGWQLLLNDYEGCMNFGNPTVAPGSESNPYTVEQAIAIEQAGTNASGWVSGFIVGAVAPETETVTSNDDVEWTSDVTLANTLVIGATADTKDISKCLVIALPSGSAFRTYGNLRDNPSNYKKAISVKGSLAKYMDTYGVTDNRGTAAEFKIEGVEVGGGTTQNGDGTEAKPFSAAQVIAMAPTSTSVAVEGGAGVWVSGYIVGWADMANIFYINAETARFSVPATMATNILVADDASETDWSKCIGIQLPNGAVRSALNLVDNPGNLGAKVALKGDIMKYSGVPGLKNTSEYKIDGAVTPPDNPVEAVSAINETFEAGAIPTNWKQVQVSGDKTWYVTTFNDNAYAAMTGYKGTKPPFDQWLVTPPIDMSKVSDKVLSFDTQVNGYGSTTSVFEVYVMTTDNPSTGTVTKLNPTIAEAPASGYSSWANSGNIDLSSYSGTIYIGFRYYATSDANYATWCIDNVVLGKAGDDPNPPTPPTPQGEYKGDFNSFNGGTPKSSPYATYTNATGWSAENSIVLSGTDNESASNPYFSFIGGAGTLAPTLNGKATAPGRLISPTLTGGCGTLTFSYGFAFAETQCQFTVRIIQNGAVVKEDTVKVTDLVQKSAYSYSLNVNVSGDFVIEIVNDCIGENSSNKERVSIWNLTWTN